MPFVTGSLPHFLTCMASLSTLSTSSLSWDPLNLRPSFRLWGLARWGHDNSSTGRPSRHWQSPSTCSFCHDMDGSLCIILLLALPTTTLVLPGLMSCGISLATMPLCSVSVAHLTWVFNPLVTRQTLFFSRNMYSGLFPHSAMPWTFRFGHVCRSNSNGLCVLGDLGSVGLAFHVPQNSQGLCRTSHLKKKKKEKKEEKKRKKKKKKKKKKALRKIGVKIGTCTFRGGGGGRSFHI